MLSPKCLIAVVACLALPSLLRAQPVPYWSTVDPRPDNTYIDAESAVFDRLGNGFVFGHNRAYDESSGEVQGDNWLLRLTKFSPTGEVLWRTTAFTEPLPFTAFNYIDSSSLVPTSDGGVIVFARLAGTDNYSTLLARVGPSGQILWKSTQHVDEGIGRGDGAAFLTSSEPSQGFSVTRLYGQGPVAWTSTAPLPGCYLTALTPDSSGGVWGAGQKYVSFPNNYQLVLAHFDATGQYQTWIFPTANLRPTGLKIDPDGNLVIVGLSEISGEYYVSLVKATPAGAVLWKRTYSVSFGYTTPSHGPAFSVDAASNIVVAYDGGVVDTSRPQVMKVSPAGDTLWSHFFVVARHSDFTRGVLADPAGNTFVVIHHQSYPFGPDGTITDLLVKYLPSGELGWPNLPQGALEFLEGRYSSPAGLGRDQWGFLYIGGSAFPTREGHHVVKLGPTNSALFVSQSVPTQMVAGQTYSVALTLSNDGLSTWTFGDGFYLRSTGPTDNLLWGRNRVDLGGTESILPGQAKTFKFSVYAPTTGGQYGFQWRMAQNSGSFGEASIRLEIPVVVKQHAARYVLQSVPTSVKAGSTFQVKVTMRNVGTNTWTAAGGYRLASVEPDFNTRWGSSIVPLAGSDSMGSGQDKVFTITCTAPSTPGSYTMRWRMQRQSSAYTGFFGDPTTVKGITVVP